MKIRIVELCLEGDSAELLHELAAALAEDATVPHSHKCGYPYGGGCGFVFQHTNLCAGSDDAHRCPSCGRGPWDVRFDPPLNEVPNGKA